MLKHVIKMQERVATQKGIVPKAACKSDPSSSRAGEDSLTAAPIGDSLFGALPATKATAVPDPKDKSATAREKSQSTSQIGIKWNELLAVCTTQMITKNDIEMRKLIGMSVLRLGLLC